MKPLISFHIFGLILLISCTNGDRNNPCDPNGSNFQGLIIASIISNPNDGTITEGQSASFAVVAQGLNISCQWQKDGNDIPNEQSAKLSISGANMGQSGLYRCIVWNDWGRDTSIEMTLTVNQQIIAPSINQNIQSHTVVEGDSLVLNIIISGTNPQVQWQRNGKDISNANANKYIITVANLIDNGKYNCIVRNSLKTISSDTAIITVIPHLNETIFTDKFSYFMPSDNHEWNIYNYTNFKSWISDDGYYYLQSDDTTYGHKSTISIPNITDTETISIEISAEFISGSVNSGFGLIIFASENDMYRISICDKQYYTISKINNQTPTVLKDWTYAPSIIKTNAANTLLVVSDRNYTYFYINNTWVETTGKTTRYGNQFGFLVSDKMKVRFDYIKIMHFFPLLRL